MVYFCQECGYESSKWMGQCPGCKAWNSFAEEPVSTGKKASGGGKSVSRQQSEPVILKEISLKEDERQTTNIGELDRVLGGGIVPGSLVLVGGDPGIGKSTLLLQVCRNLAENGSSVLYISGEESLRQIKLRANRIGTFNENLQLLCETNLDTVREVMERKKPDVAIIDSIQTMFDEKSDLRRKCFPGERIYQCTDADCKRIWNHEFSSLVDGYQGGERGWTESVGAHGRHSALF